MFAGSARSLDYCHVWLSFIVSRCVCSLVGRLALAGSGWLWLALAGAGWRWLAVAGWGWLWLAGRLAGLRRFSTMYDCCAWDVYARMLGG